MDCMHDDSSLTSSSASPGAPVPSWARPEAAPPVTPAPSGRRRFLRALGVGGAASVAAVAASQSPAAALTPNDHSSVILVAAKNAPRRVKLAAIRSCRGSNDQTNINAVINNMAGTGGVVQLSEGTFNISGPILMRQGVMLVGRGRGTHIKATAEWAAWDGEIGALIEPADGGVARTRVSNMTIDGRYKNIKGIYYNINSQANFDDPPDSKHIFSDLYIMKTGSHAFHMEGSQNRGIHVNQIRVWNAGGHGYLISSPDAYYSHCETGSSGLAGFRVESSNLHFSQCKSWYSDADGWEISSWRNAFTACESQDNEGHGFYVTAGPNAFSSCIADSNAHNPGGAVPDKDGFHILGKRNALAGCIAFDKNESQRGFQQRYGFYLGPSSDYTQLTGTVKDNRVGGLAGPGATNALSNISVLG